MSKITTEHVYSKSQKLLECFINMNEADFTKVVLIPLFIKLGYDVDYYGGPSEGGKDLICWKTADFGASELLVIQVKRTSASGAAASSDSFAGLVNQLQQASEKKVCSKQGQYYRPNKIYFITPFPLKTRALETRFEKYQELATRGVRVLDGNLIANEVLRLLPALADDLCGNEYLIKHKLASNLSNTDLSNALNCRTEKNIGDFYCDLDFGVGRITSKIFFSLISTPSIRKHTVAHSKWESIAKCANSFFDHANIIIIQGGVSSVTAVHEQQRLLFNRESNQRLIRILDSSLSDLKANIFFTLSEIHETASNLLQFNASKEASKSSALNLIPIENFQEIENIKSIAENLILEHKKIFTTQPFTSEMLDGLSQFVTKIVELSNNVRDSKKIINFISEVALNSIFTNTSKSVKLLVLVAERVVNRINEPLFEFIVDGGIIAEQLHRYQTEVSDGIDLLSTGKLTKVEIKLFMNRCQNIFILVGDILNEKILADAAGLNPAQTYSLDAKHKRISLPLSEIFATGLHCAVFGDAGAGKSTTLYRYAFLKSLIKDEDEITLFLPLTRVISNSKDDSVTDVISAVEKLEMYIARYLDVQAGASDEEILNFLKIKTRVTFIFDGVDEVIKSAPWVVAAIHEIPNKYENCQVIISSRASGRYLDATGFLCLTILPFTPIQVEFFVERWFKDDLLLAADVNAHLRRTPSLTEIITNPLLSTVLCTLAENGIPLPVGELEMYSERMKLLLGKYDIHKKSVRLISSQSILENVARKLAFYLHKNNRRELSMDDLEKIAIKLVATPEGFKRQQVILAVKELNDPCNILEPMTDDGMFGFGHLRYQEYLCATQLHANRGIDLEPLLVSTWWRPVIVLFARLTDDVRPIIEDIISKQHHVTKYFDTLVAVIETTSPPLKHELMTLINMNVLQDKEEFGVIDFNDDNFDYDEDVDLRRLF
jgi:hypothetical protein